MNPQINHNTKVPTERDNRISDALQKSGDMIHKIDTTNYCEGILKLTSNDEQQLHEGVLISENFLSYNGSWDFHRNTYKKNDSYICELSFKWNGYLSIQDRIISKLKLPSGVKKQFEFSYRNICDNS